MVIIPATDHQVVLAAMSGNGIHPRSRSGFASSRPGASRSPLANSVDAAGSGNNPTVVNLEFKFEAVNGKPYKQLPGTSWVYHPDTGMYQNLDNHYLSQDPPTAQDIFESNSRREGMGGVNPPAAGRRGVSFGEDTRRGDRYQGGGGDSLARREDWVGMPPRGEGGGAGYMFVPVPTMPFGGYGGGGFGGGFPPPMNGGYYGFYR